MRGLSVARSLLGAALLWGSAGVAGYAISWTIRSHQAAARELSQASGDLSAARSYDAGTSCSSGSPRAGQLAGYLEVPKLSLRAPVEQGESDAVLSGAVGHDASSVWPGSDGTSVLAAHDVSFFARIGQLRPGDKVIYVSACRTTTFVVTGHRIVRRGAPVANTSGPTLVLDTCWPNDALWWTPDRELVMARQLSSRPRRGGSGRLTGTTRPVASQPIAVPTPPALAAEGLTLDENPTLLGTMQVNGRPAPGLVQSPEPLDVEEAALTAYYGALHAIAAGNRGWFSAVAPGVTFPSELSGAHVSGYVTRLSVDLVALGSQVTGARLQAVVGLSLPNGEARDVQLDVAAAISHGQLTITSWKAS